MRYFINHKKLSILIISSVIVIIIIIIWIFHSNRNKSPEIADNIIMHPTFATSIGEFSAGTFFVMKPNNSDKLLAITALHIFGPNGGLDRQYNTSELKSLIKDITLVDAYDQSDIKLMLEPFTIPGAEVRANTADGDVAAFVINSNNKTDYLRFSTDSVNKGDKVWLVTSASSGAPSTQKTHSATVLSTNNNQIKIKYDNNNLKFSGTSGSPIINKDGEVIGINVGYKMEQGNCIGYSNPALRANILIEEALKGIVK